MSSQVLVWLAAVAAIVVLARLRGWRGIKILLACLLVVFLSAIVWNLTVSFRHSP
jgi:hypothetical protein